MKISDIIEEDGELNLKIDKNASPAEVQQARKMAERNPARASREQVAKARADKAVAQSSTSPTRTIDMQIAQAEEKLARLRQRRQGMTK